MDEYIEQDDFDPAMMDEAPPDDAAHEAALVRLNAFGLSLAKTRDAAVSGRMQAGIDAEWGEDEDAYEGIDDANREFATNSKPISSEGGAVPSRLKESRSTVFLNITRPYVDAAAAKVSDMLLPTDERNWGLRPTPIPEMVGRQDEGQPMQTAAGEPIVKMGPDGQPQPFTATDMAQYVAERAKEAAGRAETRINDWMVECQYSSEVRKVIEDCAKLGSGVVKGPYPTLIKSRALSKEGGMTQVVLAEKIAPASRRVDPWNFFPDPACGESIHNGSYVWERDMLTAYQLQQLAEDPAYIADSIFAVLEEGPGVTKSNGMRRNHVTQDDDRFEVWYYHGYASHEDMEAAGCGCGDRDLVPCIVTMVNSTVIKAAISPLDSGEFPYDVMAWQRRTNHWTGIGVSRQMRTPQRMLNGAARNMMDNAGLSAGPQLIFRRDLIEPADGDWQLRPRKEWYVTEEADNRSVADAFMAINIPSMQGELMGIVQFAMKMAEDVTSLPMLLQGQQGHAPDTVGGMTMMVNNASTVLRRIARTFDDCVTEPHVRRYYEWLLLDPDVPTEEKGDYKIEARGSSALVERDIQNQVILQSLQLSLNPAFEINPAKAYREYLRSQRIDVRKLDYTDEEKQRLAQSQQQQPQDPAIVRAQAMLQTQQMKSEVDTKDIDMRIQDAREEREFRLQMAQLERDTEIVKLANVQRMSVDKIKAQLAQTAMKEKNRREIFDAETHIKMTTGSGI